MASTMSGALPCRETTPVCCFNISVWLRHISQRLQRIELHRFHPALDRRLKKLAAVTSRPAASAARRDTMTAQSYSLVRLSSRAQVFTVSPMAVMICESRRSHRADDGLAEDECRSRSVTAAASLPSIWLLSWSTRAKHFARAAQGVGGAGRGVLGVETVKRHQPVAGELRVMAVGRTSALVISWKN